jgi:hypothetical protein
MADPCVTYKIPNYYINISIYHAVAIRDNIHKNSNFTGSSQKEKPLETSRESTGIIALKKKKNI